MKSIGDKKWMALHCVGGCGFSHTLALYCRQINDALSIFFTSYSYIHPGAGLLYMTTHVHEQRLCRQTCAWSLYSVLCHCI